MRPRRGYSDDEVDAAVLADQLRRHHERRNDPRWQLVDDEWSDVFGPTWQEVREAAMATRTGVFIEWNEEQSTVAREDVGTIRERYIIKRVEIVTKRALWSNEISPSTIAAAERYAESDSTDDRKLRVAVVPPPAAGRR